VGVATQLVHMSNGTILVQNARLMLQAGRFHFLYRHIGVRNEYACVKRLQWLRFKKSIILPEIIVEIIVVQFSSCSVCDVRNDDMDDVGIGVMLIIL